MAPTPRKTRQLEVLITGFGPFMSVGNNPSWLAVKPLHGTFLDLSHAPCLYEDRSRTDEADEGVVGEVRTRARARARARARIQTLQVPVHYASVLDVVPRIHGSQPCSPAAKFWYDSRLDSEFGGRRDQHYPEAYPIDVPDPVGGALWDVVIHVGVGRQGTLRCETQAHKSGYTKRDANNELAPLLSHPGRTEHLEEQDGARGFGTGYEQFDQTLSTRISVSQLVTWLKQRGLRDDEVDQSFDPGRYLCDFIFYCSLCEAKRMGDTLVLFVHVPPADRNLSVQRCTQAIRAIAWFMASHKASTHIEKDT